MHEHESIGVIWEMMAHGHCLLWEPWLLWPTVIGDAVTFVAYMAISVVLWACFRRGRGGDKRTKFVPDQWSWAFLSFSAFVFLCGITHMSSIVMIWHGLYWVHMAIVAACGAVSTLTAGIVVIEGWRRLRGGA